MGAPSKHLLSQPKHTLDHKDCRAFVPAEKQLLLRHDICRPRETKSGAHQVVHLPTMRVT
jgi:hypothetical protein